ncbi:3-phosphoglycerate dehydrogenase [Pseudoroseomonas deserti]|uniref:3-phosphoglycerate dehydrogenase n=1 Tax=Teichococcus deserti TaxID=1817963 RepID=A0A1V2H7M7_9PROT|nr:NAD(P)-dependent oxidoreductase [Pseudoroseomonas deserti]ONG58119.1 3-phosphoglycerate dehydrogenase [Pseudoroseomonas deserti]
MSTIFLDCFDDMIPLWKAVAAAGDPTVVVNIEPGQPADIPALLAGHDTCIVDHSYFDAGLLGRCPDLKHIVFLGTGASSFIDLAAAEKNGITVHTIKGYGDTTVAEHTIALALSAARGVAKMDREVRAGQWRQVEGLQVNGKVLGIVGLGGIGREVARMGQGLGMKVVAWNRSPVESPACPMAPLEEVLATADILCLTMALNDGSRGFLNAERLKLTKKGVIFVNTARADIVDNAALVALLREGHVRHAALDVFSQEPPAGDDPFLGLDNVTLTAHAGFMTPEATMTMLRRALDIVISVGG